MRVSNKMPAQCGRIYTLRLASLALSFRLVRLFITKGKAERREVFRPKGLFAFSLLLVRLFRGGLHYSKPKREPASEERYN